MILVCLFTSNKEYYSSQKKKETEKRKRKKIQLMKYPSRVE